MLERIKGALLLLPFAIAFFCGDVIFSLFAIILGFIAFFELKGAFKEKSINLSNISAVILGIFLLFQSLNFFDGIAMNDVIIGMFFIFSIFLIFQKQNIVDISVNVLSLCYAFIPFGILAYLYREDVRLAILVFVISFSTDIFAYFSGKLFGKHKLIPAISPKKTIEGSVGAIICTLIIGIIFAIITELPIIYIVIISLFGSVIAQLGDLFASAIKRYCGIKDFGKLIPGHGGILDRFDSVIFVSLLVYLF